MRQGHVRMAGVDPLARVGLGLAGLALGVGVASFGLGCSGWAGYGVLGMFLAMGLVILSLGLYAHGTHRTPPLA